MKATTLVILAAGLGTRYGGLKQLEPVTAAGETILDFSLFDALRCGVANVVFVVRTDILEAVRRAFTSIPEFFERVSYVCQDKAGPPRMKPWGTGHALLSAKPEVADNFLTINADDFYGRAAFELMSNHEASPKGRDFALAGYELSNTLSEHGAVSRGECLVGADGMLTELIERKSISRVGKAICSEKGHQIAPAAAVSMNFWAFSPLVFDLLESRFARFSESAGREDEFYLNEAMSDAVARNEAKIRVLRTDSEWMGITYFGDRGEVGARLEELKAEGIYPDRLW